MQIVMLDPGRSELAPQSTDEPVADGSLFEGTLDRVLQGDAESDSGGAPEGQTREGETPYGNASGTADSAPPPLAAGAELSLLAEPRGSLRVEGARSEAQPSAESPRPEPVAHATLGAPEQAIEQADDAPPDATILLVRAQRAATRASDAGTRQANATPTPGSVGAAPQEPSFTTDIADRVSSAAEPGAAGAEELVVPAALATTGRSSPPERNEPGRALDALGARPVPPEAAAVARTAERTRDEGRASDRSRDLGAAMSAARRGESARESLLANLAARELESGEGAEAQAGLPRPMQAAAAPRVDHPIVMPAAAEGVAAASGPARAAPASSPAQPVDQIPQHVELLATRGGGTARLRLDPPELGHVEITVAMRGSIVDVMIQADEPAAQLAVLAHSEQLSDALAMRDLRMDRLDVTSSQPGDREPGQDGPLGFGSDPEAEQGALRQQADAAARSGARRAADALAASGVNGSQRQGVSSGSTIDLHA